MKLGPVTKLDKRNKTTSERFDDDVICKKFYVIVTSLTIWRYPKAGFQTLGL